jgi:hypothetical protein
MQTMKQHAREMAAAAEARRNEWAKSVSVLLVNAAREGCGFPPGSREERILIGGYRLALRQLRTGMISPIGRAGSLTVLENEALENALSELVPLEPATNG